MEEETSMASAAVSWSELPHDLLQHIFKRLVLSDHLSFVSVCTSWRSAVAQSKSHLHGGDRIFVGLIVPGKSPHSKTRRLLQPSLRFSECYYEDDTNAVNIAVPHGYHCCGSKYGWLILVDDSLDMHLFNPLLDSKIQLPSVYTANPLEWRVDKAGRSIVNKAFLSSDPSSSSSETFVLMIYYGVDMAFCRLGDNVWTVLKPLREFRYNSDAVYHEGKFYVVYNPGGIVTIDIHAPTDEGVIQIEHARQPPREIFVQKRYLVESNGDLFQIRRIEGNDDDDYASTDFDESDDDGGDGGNQVAGNSSGDGGDDGNQVVDDDGDRGGGNQIADNSGDADNGNQIADNNAAGGEGNQIADNDCDGENGNQIADNYSDGENKNPIADNNSDGDSENGSQIADNSGDGNNAIQILDNNGNGDNENQIADNAGPGEGDNNVASNSSEDEEAKNERAEQAAEAIRRYRTRKFKIFKLGQCSCCENKAWLRVHNIGDRAFFIGCHGSFSVSASELFGCQPNSIYFTDNNVYGSARLEPIHHDIGVYNLEDNTVKEVYPINSQPVWPTALWFGPLHGERKSELDHKAKHGETVVPAGIGGETLGIQEHLAEGSKDQSGGKCDIMERDCKSGVYGVPCCSCFSWRGVSLAVLVCSVAVIFVSNITQMF